MAKDALSRGEEVGGRCRILFKLGEGASGQTYLAELIQSGEKVALKRLRLRGSDPRKNLELFDRDTKVLRTLHHPSIARFLDAFTLAGKEGTSFYLAQTLQPGVSLQTWADQGNRLDEAGAKAMASELLPVLTHLHRQSPPVIHRDIKPNNIIRNPEGMLVLVDIGALRDTSEGAPPLGATGTYGFQPPEQHRGAALPATDLYALGATLVYLLTGKTVDQLPLVNQRVVLPAEVPLSRPFAGWLLRLLEPAPEDRYQSAEVARTALVSGKVEEKKSGSRAGLVIGLFALTLALGGAGGGYWYWKTRSSPKLPAPGSVDTAQASAQVSAPDPRRLLDLYPVPERHLYPPAPASAEAKEIPERADHFPPLRPIAKLPPIDQAQRRLADADASSLSDADAVADKLLLASSKDAKALLIKARVAFGRAMVEARDYQQSGLSEATEWLNKALAIDAEMPGAHLLKGWVLLAETYKLKQDDKKEFFTRALAEADRGGAADAADLLRLEVAIEDGRASDAVTLGIALVGAARDSASLKTAYDALIDALVSDRRYAAAAAVYRWESASLTSHSAGDPARYAEFFLRSGEPQHALEIAGAALAKEDSPALHRLVARANVHLGIAALWDQGKPEAAAGYWEAALKDDPRSLDALYGQLVVKALAAAEKKEACSDCAAGLDKILEIKPDYAPALAARANLSRKKSPSAAAPDAARSAK